MINYLASADGNKRSALIATHTFYLINGHRLIVEPGDIIGLALAVAQGILDTDETDDMHAVATRLEAWAQPIKYDDQG